MKKRKLIALITTNPESLYQQRVMNGVFGQCEKYGYDVAVFSPLVAMSHHFTDYRNAELNIYNLINYDLIDGVIVTAISLSENNTAPVFNKMLDILKERCKQKVVSLDLPFGDYEVCYTDDRSAFKEITRHIYDVHKCSRIYFLTGFKDNPGSIQRLGGYLDFFEEKGIDTDENNIFYGDFWYSAGEQLADDIFCGRVKMPDAVICASDHMAMGLAGKLKEHGIDVPGQIIVTGYDATPEAIINDISITSYEPPISKAAAEAVNNIRSANHPELPVFGTDNFAENGIYIGESCGCLTNINYMKKKLNTSVYTSNHNHLHKNAEEPLDISRLLESYMYENLVSTNTPDDCLDQIYQCTYLIHPYEDFYLCLKGNWLEINDNSNDEYPEKMKIAIHSNGKYDTAPAKMPCVSRTDDIGTRTFNTSDMLPEMHEYHEKPYVYYFSPVHFGQKTLGYSVLSCELSQQHKIDYVFRNWIRNVNNALEMTRIRSQLLANSILDITTGLYNRRGMFKKLNEMIPSFNSNKILVIMVDVDGLKRINDNYGHHEGDFAITIIADSLKAAAQNNEICIRNGGDEFLLIGTGDYSEAEIHEKIKLIKQAVKEKAQASNKPYEISASIGFCCSESDGTNIDNLITVADKNMYRDKRRKYKNKT